MAINFLNTVAVDDSVLFVDTINDRVGVGTTDPDAKLSVTSTTIDSEDIVYLKSGADNVNDYLGIAWEIGIGGNGPHAAIRVAGGPSSSDARLGLFTTSDGGTLVEGLSVVHNGNVGIGTTGPGEKLSVVGDSGDTNIIVYDSSANSEVGLKLQNDAKTWTLQNWGSGGDNLRLLNNAGNTVQLWDDNGNVGIGTTDPGAKLQIGSATYAPNSNLSNNLLQIKSSSGFAYLTIGNGDTANATSYIGGASGFIVLGSVTDAGATSEHVRITDTGNVGVGTTNPINKLQVNYSPYGIDDLTASSGTAATNWNRNAGLMITGASISNALALGASGTANDRKAWIQVGHPDTAANSLGSLALNPLGGNVGIGTTSPSEKLDVDGNIKIKNALLSNQENTDIDSAAAEVVAQVAHATYTAAFFDFVVKKGTNVRSGTVYACHNGDSTPLVEFTETSTNDLGDTSDVTLSVDISGANMRLVATVASDDWSVKSLIRAI